MALGRMESKRSCEDMAEEGAVLVTEGGAGIMSRSESESSSITEETGGRELAVVEDADDAVEKAEKMLGCLGSTRERLESGEGREREERVLKVVQRC